MIVKLKKKYPDQFETGTGKVDEFHRVTFGRAVTFQFSGTQIVIIASNTEDVKEAFDKLVDGDIEMDDSRLQDVAVFGRKTVTEFKS